MFGMGMIKRNAAREEMSDIETWLIGQSLRFAVEITDAHNDVPQFLAATEGLAFALHALRRETYRSHEFKAWDGIFEPAMKNMYQVFAMTISAWSNSDLDRNRLAGDAQAMVSARSLEYQTLPFLNGPMEDRQTVVHAAARRIGECVDPARRDEVVAAAAKLYGRIVEFELPDQVANLAKALYGRRAAVAA